MTDHQEPILFKRTEAPGPIHGGVPNRDLTRTDWDRLNPVQRRAVRHSRHFVAAELTPAQKGAQTRRENEQREAGERQAAEDEAARIEAEETEAARLQAEAAALAETDADAAAKQAGSTGNEGGE